MSIKKHALQMVGRAKRPATKFRPKAIEGGNLGCFLTFDKCWNVIFGVAEEYVGMDARVKLGDSMLNSSRIIQLNWLLATSVLRTFV